MKCKIFFSLIFIAILSFSCNEDLLYLVPETSISAPNFFKTKTHFDQATIGAYNGLRQIAISGVNMDEMRSDNTFYTYYSGDRGTYNREEITILFLDDPNVESRWAYPRYSVIYANIAKLNTILGRMESSEMTEEEKNKIKAEALFLRAFYYFDLVQHWGPVPLVLEEVVSEEQAFQPNSTIEDVYSQIVSDVKEAIQIGLPVADSFPQSGRATLGAAKMLLAYVYMTKPTREYALAEKELIDITNMNYGLLSEYADVFNPNNKNHKESIFEVQYKEGTGGQHSDFAWRMIPKTTNTEFLMGVKASNTGYDSGGWNVPTQELIDSYEDGDKRLNASIAVVEGNSDGEVITAEAVKNPDGYIPLEGQGYFYFVRKYWHPPYTQGWNTGDNFPIYRYSGALLLLSECLVEQGKSNEALPFINQVRERAGLGLLSNVTMEDVANEMRHELSFENHRWTDLIRTGLAIETMKKFGDEMKRLHYWVPDNAFEIEEYKLIYPFYHRELEINKNLVQNPGY
jgi:hypothetical protein